ncbi:MAG: hypothetical protein JNK17_08825 [Hydrogenophaga sp.]|uniref:hypothetical protein n=1 Tax=Hydrogenophaga sp. TaxID=1904254 RepID=UPI001A4EB047|nr:hypothetical protein [Hydrogenophaga sp.]
MKTAVAAALLLMLAACTTPPKAEWVKPQASKDETYTQLSDCSYQVGLAKVPEGERELMVAHCMRGKGYRYVAVPVAPAK